MDRADWAPSPDDVGAVIRARTKDANGNETGTFNADTRPTGDQCQDIIDTITSELAALCGPVPDQVQDNARRTAAIGVAAEVELSFWPEQVGTNRSPYDRLYARYLDMRASLKMQVADLNGGDTNTNNANLLPVFGFPSADVNDPNAFVGWSSRW